MELLLNDSVESDNITINNYNKLYDKWTLWAHLPHDTNWNINSYKKIITFDSVESIVALYKEIPENMVKNCMLFLMRDGIVPTWEDKRNKNGGCFSYKINNKYVTNIWKRLSYNLVGENLTDNLDLLPNINGITISPKINFCIIKIWISNCEYKSAELIKNIDELKSDGCLFKKHIQE
tara:strand:- start:5921 stop:6454 length:534 start_codon:yes stop_codon:yes gene_type:complete